MPDPIPKTQSNLGIRAEACAAQHRRLRRYGFAAIFALKRSIGRKLVVWLASMFVLFIAINETVHQLFIKPTFSQRDQADSVEEITRVLAAINQETDQLNELAKVLRWTDQDLPKGQLSECLSDDSFQINTSSQINTPSRQDPSNPTPGHASPGHPSFKPSQLTYLIEAVKSCLDDERRECRGVLRFPDHTVVIVAAIPNRSEDGLLIVGRPFHDALVSQISHRTGVDFRIRSAHGMSPNWPTTVLDPRTQSIFLQTQLRGLDGQPTSDVSLKVESHHATHFAHAFATARRSFVLCSIAALLFLLLLIGRIIVRPLVLLRTQICEISEGAADVELLQFDSEDEIADLAESFEKMMNRLSTTKEQLTIASLESGRSEVAANVIHNVGNVLTNVNSLVDTARVRIGNLQVTSLHRLAERLDQTDSDPEMLAATPKYLHGLAKKWEQDQQELNALLMTLEDNLRHIHDVIRDQQRHTKQSIKLEQVSLRELIDEAIGCCRAKLDSDSVAVTVPSARDALSKTQVMVDRSLTLQVMINIITNARQAMHQNSVQTRPLRVSIASVNGLMEVSFRDEGSGMDAKTVEQAFDAHFTTRETGSGLGLHFCAISLKRFGGAVRVESSGTGAGCTVTISLPRHTMSEQTAKVSPMTFHHLDSNGFTHQVEV